MSTLRVAAVQASFVLMNRDATIDRVAELTSEAARQGAQLVAFPEVFVPGTPVWIDTSPIWDGDEDWFALLADNAVTVPSSAADRLAAIAAEHQVWLVVGVNERKLYGGTIYNTVLYFSPRGELAGRHRKLMPTGSERTVWGMGDGSTLPVIDTGLARIGGLTCWENYMPLVGFYLYSRGVDVWLAPTWRSATAGSPPCGTWPGRTACMSSESTPSCTQSRYRPTSQHVIGSSRRRTWRPIGRGWRKATASSSARTAACSSALSARARKPSSPILSCGGSPLVGATWTRSATTTARTSSGCMWTPRHGRPSPRHRSAAP